MDMIVIVSRLQNGQPLAACQSGLGFSDLTQLEINWGSQPWGFRGVCVCVSGTVSLDLYVLKA